MLVNHFTEKVDPSESFTGTFQLKDHLSDLLDEEPILDEQVFKFIDMVSSSITNFQLVRSCKLPYLHYCAQRQTNGCFVPSLGKSHTM